MPKENRKKPKEINLFWMCVIIVAIVGIVGIVSMTKSRANQEIQSGQAYCTPSTTYSCSGSYQVMTEKNLYCVVKTTKTLCKYGCDSRTGKCYPMPPAPTSTTRPTTIRPITTPTTTRPITSGCTETDQGVDPKSFGTCKQGNGATYDDACVNSQSLKEYYCRDAVGGGKICDFGYINCATMYGLSCNAGACK